MFFENLKAICEKKNTSPTAVALAVGMAKSNVTGWKKGQEPSIMTAVKIANYLGVDVSDLSKEIAQQKSDFEYELIGYRNGRIYENVILNNLSGLCKSHTPKVTIGKMCNDLGLSRSLITKLKADPQKTITGDTAQKIADYFGVSVDRVLGTDQKEKSPAPEGAELDAETIELMDIWGSADKEEREALLAIAKVVMAKRNK